MSSLHDTQAGAVLASESREQRSVNQSSLGQRAAFASHRAKVTDLVCASARAESGRVCVLGAGNCNDLDLNRLLRHYAEVHLVDLDHEAVSGAIARLGNSERARVKGHAPLDISGSLGRLDRWRAFQVTPEELMAFPSEVARTVMAALPGPFDVVVSACVLTQLQLSVLRALTPQHRLFEAARQLTNLAHFRVMQQLMGPNGRGLFVTDVSSDEICDLEPFARLEHSTDRVFRLEALAHMGKLFYAVEPGLIELTFRQDPELVARVGLEPIADAWLWRNGPSRTLLTYALPFTRR